jgi:hypothetical protein
LASHPAPDLAFIESKSGFRVPVLERGSRRFALHSTVDPEREARRIREQHAGAGFIVFLGLGAGYQIKPFLGDIETAGALVIEKDCAVVRAILEKVDLSPLFRDDRFRLLVDPTEEEVEAALLSRYMPSVMGNMRSLPLRPRYETESVFFNAISSEIERAVLKIRADIAVQAHFGRRWFMNILNNLPLMESASLDLNASPTAVIAGAGPSLEVQLASLRSRKHGLLIATDTALPVLIAHDVRPDLAISIDCQNHGYHHFLCADGYAISRSDVPFLLELASPPSLVRQTVVRGFFAGGHPFSRYILRHWRKFPALDTSGGNVSHAAVSLALALGAREITLCGTDFSYPEGKPYARGTYMSRLFDSRSTRLLPAETSFLSLVFRPDVMKENMGGSISYTTPLLLSYRGSIERLLRKADTVTCFEGKGLPLATGGTIGDLDIDRETGVWETPPIPVSGWHAFLKAYEQGLASLPSPTSPAHVYLRMLPGEKQELWFTVLPLVPGIERETRASEDRAELLSKALSWALARVRQVLGQP